MTATNTFSGLEIAIIGLSGRFPESIDHRAFWRHLKEGRELIRTFTDEELRLAGVQETMLQNEHYVKSVGVIPEKDRFDHLFFGYSSEEAELMDPQTRLFHEQCWMALDDSGYAGATDNNKIGLFAGASVNDSWKIYAYSRAEHSSVDPFYLNILASQQFLCTLVSYKLNLRGPSVYVDTACSGSLTAVHLACRSLLTKECSIALAGGVSVKTVRKKGYMYQEGMVASRDGHCRTFDAAASGTASGEGLGVVVLKRLNEAIRDKDHIYAVIRATAANNDGNNKVGYAAPSVKGQAECIQSAMKLAGVDARSIGYVEAHGTATRLGDPIEVRALNEAFAGGHAGLSSCALGSVKTNIGHLDAAAGVAGLIKTALSLKYGLIPPSLHFQTPNPEIDFKSGPFFVSTGLEKFPVVAGLLRRAGISSFGIGGTNVHAVLEEGPARSQTGPGPAYKLLTVSAKTPASLQGYLNALQRHLLEESDTDAADMAYTLQTGRRHFAYRHSLVYRELSDLQVSLRSADRDGDAVKSAAARSVVVFMFPGQGSQYVNMGRDLYDHEPLFRTEMDKGFAILEGLTGRSWKQILYGDAGGKDLINKTYYTQPLVFLTEYCLARYIMSLGIQPQYMIGHSVGEYVAACVSGVFGFEDAMRLIIRRGELMGSLEEGVMLSLPVGEDEAALIGTPGAWLAAVNSPGQVVFSGDLSAMDRLTEKLNIENIPYSKLRTSHAFHSGMQDPIMPAFREAVESVRFETASIPFVSNLTGRMIRAKEACSPDYWVKHMRGTVRFSDGVSSILSQDKDLIFIEVGAGTTLGSLVKQQSENLSATFINLVRSYKEQEDDRAFFLRGLGQLWSKGVAIQWPGLYGGEKRNKVSLPPYSFETSRHPAEVDPFERLSMPGLNGARKNSKEARDWLYHPSWKQEVADPAVTGGGVINYLVFQPDEEIVSSLIGPLMKDNEDGSVVEVLPGEAFKKISRNRYIINPLRADHFLRLAASLKEDQWKADEIIHAWALQAVPGEIRWNQEDRTFNLVYFSLVRVLQSFFQDDPAEGKRVIVVTRSLHKVVGNEVLSYVQSLLLGLANCIPGEYGASCVNIDMAATAEGGTDQLANEIRNSRRKASRVVALRYGRRWVPDLQKYEGPVRNGSIIRRGGLYLITGGLGNAGYTLAKYLMEQYQARVILTGRGTLPQDGATGARAQRWQLLQSIGGYVQYFSADVGVKGELEKIVEDIERDQGPFNGIIHTAGVIGQDHMELIRDSSPEKTLAMLAPKVKGIETIYTIFKDRKPDLVWITSSLSTILGGLGFSAYSAANLFMDSFVQARSGELPGWKCVDLAGLSDSETGAGTDSSSFTPAELAGLFEQSLFAGDCAVLFCDKGDLPARIKELDTGRARAILATNAQKIPGKGVGAAKNQTRKRQQRADLSVPYAAPRTVTEERLQNVFEEFFFLEQVGIDDDFFQLGGDSLKGMMLLKRVTKQFGTRLTLHDFFLLPSIRGIAGKVDEYESNEMSI